jgi:hypothetical protein
MFLVACLLCALLIGASDAAGDTGITEDDWSRENASRIYLSMAFCFKLSLLMMS